MGWYGQRVNFDCSDESLEVHYVSAEKKIDSDLHFIKVQNILASGLKSCKEWSLKKTYFSKFDYKF